MTKFFAGLFMAMFFLSALIAQDIKLKQSYSSKKYGFSIKYPLGWEKKEDISPYIPVLFMEPVEGDNDTFRENVNIVIEDVKNYSLEQYYEGNFKVLKEGLNSFKDIESGDKEINKLKSKWLIYEHTYLETAVKVLVYFFVYNDKGYVVTCSSSPESFDAHKNIFETITGSFKKK